MYCCIELSLAVYCFNLRRSLCLTGDLPRTKQIYLSKQANMSLINMATLTICISYMLSHASDPELSKTVPAHIA